jgi:transposase-like protein
MADNESCPKCGNENLFDRTGLVGSDVVMECCFNCGRVWNSDQQAEIDTLKARLAKVERIIDHTLHRRNLAKKNGVTIGALFMSCIGESESYRAKHPKEGK